LSKKKFTEGLESLFGEENDKELMQEEKGFLFPPDEAVVKPKAKSKKKKPAGKNFAQDIEGFLSDAFEESFERQLSAPKAKASTSARAKKRSRKPRSGLDLLIRNTVKPSTIKMKGTSTRRVTLTFDEKKLEKLKSIARKEHLYLKDIINDIVSEFLESYRKKPT
jgi:hypothetical protein